MNPPYKAQMHLKMIESVLDAFPESTIVNVSPIRWLQDPLIDYKVHCALRKYENVAKKIISIEKVGSCFEDTKMTSDLGIYELKPCDEPIDCKTLAYDETIDCCMKHADLLMKDLYTKEPGEFSCRIPYIHGNPGCLDFLEVVSPSYEAFCSKKTSKSCYFVNMNSETERRNFFDSLFLDLYKYFNLKCKLSLRTVAEIPILRNYKEKVDNGALCKQMSLSSQQTAHIHNAIQQYLSICQ